MSNYINGRRGPNVSQYLANLNTIPSENATQEFNFNDESLDLFTNTEFFDFDSTQLSGFDQNVGFSPPPPPGQPHSAKPGMNYQFSEFQTFPPPMSSTSPSSLPPTPPNGLQGPYPPQPVNFSSPQSGDKRKASVAGNIPSPADLEEASRMAAEEDKRRRNTAASARFRVKKKQREQALEKQTREMAEKVQAFESKIAQLEQENKWLKSLITEKADSNPGAEAAFKEFADKMREADERSSDARKDGVGTEDAKEIENSG